LLNRRPAGSGPILASVRALFVAGALAALAGAVACQAPLSIDPNVTILDGGVAADGNPDGAAFSCTSSSAILCDDFEEGTIDTSRWSLIQMGATVSIDATRGNAGSGHSLHAQSDAVDAAGAAELTGMLYHSETLPEHFFLRLFAYVPSPLPPAVQPDIFVIVQKLDVSGMQLYEQSSDLAFTSWANQPTLNLSSGTLFTPNGWRCVEWEIQETSGGQANGSMNVWLDGLPVSGLNLNDVVTPQYNVLQFGISFGKSVDQAAYDLWVDDIAVTTTRIGCSP
jgi:hypothetical protein